ncbi:EAL domain-containing protein [Rhodoferax sp. 4810]|nr:EAL domain-containing protein [Rhodoferax jenense]
MALNFYPLRSLKTRVTLLTLLLFVISIWSLAFYTSRILREDMERSLGERQFSEVSGIAREINDRLSERKQALETIAKEVTPAILSNSTALQTLLEQRPLLQLLFNGGVFITGTDGTAMADVPQSAGRIGTNYIDRESVSIPLKEGKTVIGRPAMGKKLGAPIFSITAPILDSRDHVLGAMVATVNLGKPNFLDRIAQTRYGKTGDYFLISRHHKLIVTSSDKSRIMQPTPTPGANLLFDRYMQGYDGFGVTVSSRGMQNLSAAKAIPVADWFILATLPTNDAFAPIDAMLHRLILGALVLTMLAGALTWWLISRLLRRQLAPLLSASRALNTQADTGQPAQALPVPRQDEIGELIGGFNRLLETLGQREIVLKDSERLLKESQSIAGLGSYTLNIATGLWTSSEVLDGLFGIDASYIRSVEGWAALIHPADRPMMSDYFRDQVVGQKQRFDKTYRIQRPNDGVVRWVHGLGKLEFDTQGNPIEMHGTIQDITERHASEVQIKTLAFSDALTQLPNRRFLMDRIDKAMANCLRRHTQCALLMVDLDNFKTLNDTQGHHQGDLVLQEVAVRLLDCVREGDTVARLGGDEFVVLLEDLSEKAEDAATHAKVVADKILVTLDQPYQLDASTHRSTASIGITLFGDASESIDDSLGRADLAMYQAKLAGHNTLRFFDPQMQVAVNARAAMETELRQAWQESQFLLHYQPQVNGQEQLIGAEALLRWQHPQRGMVSPAEFIPMAEETGLILKLGRWVLESACRQLALWAAIPERAQLSISVNVSAREFNQLDFVEQVLGTLNRTGATAQHLKLELTESVLVTNIEEVIAKMNDLKAIGVTFSLDDFGTGYSSLSYLKRLPLDQLKIDQGFVRDILIDTNDAAIARMVIALANTLGLGVIAEGVETEGQRDFLATLGCFDYQGYLYSRPITIEAFEALANHLAAYSRQSPSPLEAGGGIGRQRGQFDAQAGCFQVEPDGFPR